MKRKIVLKESELVNLINKVINEKQSQDCKCCKAGVRTPPIDTILAWEAAKTHHRECCRRCKDEGGMVSNDGRRRKFNEQDEDREWQPFDHEDTPVVWTEKEKDKLMKSVSEIGKTVDKILYQIGQ